MSEYLDEVFSALSSIRVFAEDLAMLSEAFELTGNDNMSDRMANMSEGLHLDGSKIRDAVSREINGRAGSNMITREKL